MIRFSQVFTPDEALAVWESLVRSFPAEERRDKEEWFRIFSSEQKFSLYKCENAHGELLAFISVWHFAGFCYVEHFAVEEQHRSRGLGSQLLLEMIGASPVVLEVEDPGLALDAGDADLRRRRIDFYRRHGFRLLDQEYVQPPYRPSDGELPMRLMLCGDLSIPVSQVITSIHRSVYGRI